MDGFDSGLLTVLLIVLGGSFGLLIFYYIVRAAVRDGIEAAWARRDQRRG